MAFKTVVENLDDVDESFRPHYKETTDQTTQKKVFVIDLDGDVNVLPHTKALRSEAAGYRVKLRDIEGKYGKISAFEGMDHAEIVAKLDRIAELEAAAGGKLDDNKINAIVEGRIKAKMTPLERQLAQLTAERDGFKTQVDTMTAKDRQRTISDAVRTAAVAMKMQTEAVDDAIMYAERVMEVNEEGQVVVKDGVGFMPGLDPKSWLTDMQPKRPHWWGPSAGGGAGGNRGGNPGLADNPWTAENWNLTKQGQIYLKDQKRAEQMAQAAGTRIGGLPPAARK
jgi:hypothetical protein